MLKFVQKSMTSRKEACSTQKSCLGHVEVLHFVCLSLYFFFFLAALMLLSQPNSLFCFSPLQFFFFFLLLFCIHAIEWMRFRTGFEIFCETCFF